MKDSQTPAERFSRFSNVPATLLHVGMFSIDHEDEELRSAAYDLLGAVCSYLKYDKSPIVASKGMCRCYLTTLVIETACRSGFHSW